MREIKFRGRDKRYDGTWEPWMYGSLDLSDLWPAIIENGAPLSVQRETVGQYTGLKDKNDIEIYEGDVLKFSWDSPCGPVEFCGMVKFRAKDAAFRFWYDDFKDWAGLSGVSRNDMEVIGNVFDNPELKERFWTVWNQENNEKSDE